MPLRLGLCELFVRHRSLAEGCEDSKFHCHRIPETASGMHDHGEGWCELWWAQNESGDAPIGDQRRGKRLVVAAQMLGTKPGQALCAVGHDGLLPD